ncbi:hypothetical protein [Acinetobacter baumannii]|nr:hypothetical protein [Acinetobacter baumannii]
MKFRLSLLSPWTCVCRYGYDHGSGGVELPGHQTALYLPVL